MTLEKYAMIERERMEGAKTVQSKTVDAANETRGYPPQESVKGKRQVTQ